jgi:hypothetical protein
VFNPRWRDKPQVDDPTPSTGGQDRRDLSVGGRRLDPIMVVQVVFQVLSARATTPASHAGPNAGRLRDLA